MKHFVLVMAWVSAGLLGATVVAQDVEYQKALERAQKQRPASLTSTARIAPTTEPGTSLVIRGQLLNVNGSPAADAVIFAYHTDREGLYDRRENGPHSWRLRGWVQTDREGRFTFETIRPGSYPNSNNPPHVHFTAYLASGERYHAGELQMAMQPKSTREEELITLRLTTRQRF